MRPVALTVIVLVLAVLWMANSSPAPRRVPAYRPTVDCRSVECKLATIELARVVPETDPTVARFRGHLDRLDASYPETRLQIGDMTVMVRGTLEKSGIPVQLSTLLSGVEAIPTLPGAPQRYAEILAMYSTLRQRGFSHDSAVTGIASVTRSLSRLK